MLAMSGLSASCVTLLIVAATVQIAVTTAPDHCPMVNCVGCPSYMTYGTSSGGCQNCDCVDYCDDKNCDDDKVCRQVAVQCDQNGGKCDYEPTCVDDPCADWLSDCTLSCDDGQHLATTPYGCDLCWCVDVNRAFGIVGQPYLIITSVILGITTQL